jgi:hypothetical protein
MKVLVSENQELKVRLPSDFPAGEAELIVLAPEEEAAKSPSGKHTIDDLIANRPVPAPGTAPVTLADMERAIAEEAAGRGGA